MSTSSSLSGTSGGRLASLIGAAEQLDGAWDGERAMRVRERTLRRHDGRVRRDRSLRRGLLVVAGAGLLVLGLLRAASSAPAEPSSVSASSGMSAGPASGSDGTPAALAAVAMSDAGYARD